MKTNVRLIRKMQLGFGSALAILFTAGILTTCAVEEDILRSYRLHAICYITKPVDLDGFLKVVKSIDNFWLSVVKLPREARS